ncbi:conserved hypothetical protein [Coccidioides posadasii str. Silveira]|uniref:Uncharacterized protein n=1 Tax=Coccidioides posadasii (strain RMSCC 757 / Silveira) TaxID=443226 RepID=E9D0U7_COCPS|nr:conserved hypothetical protein [Coccidioides posadasii str. Silveira]
MAINTYGVRARKEDSGTPSCPPGRSESGFPEDDDTRTVPAVPTGPFARINRRRRGDEGIPRKKVEDGSHTTPPSHRIGPNGLAHIRHGFSPSFSSLRPGPLFNCHFSALFLCVQSQSPFSFFFFFCLPFHMSPVLLAKHRALPTFENLLAKLRARRPGAWQLRRKLF